MSNSNFWGAVSLDISEDSRNGTLWYHMTDVQSVQLWVNPECRWISWCEEGTLPECGDIRGGDAAQAMINEIRAAL